MQAGLHLCYSQTSEDRFSCDEAHMDSVCWVIFQAFLSPADLFQNQLFCLSGILLVSTNLAPDQVRHHVRPDLNPNC